MSDPVGRGAAETAATDAAQKALKRAPFIVRTVRGDEGLRETAALVARAVLAAVGSDTPTYEPIPGWRVIRDRDRVHRYEDPECDDDRCQPVFRRVLSPDAATTESRADS